MSASTVQDILKKTTEFFRAKKIENPRLEAEQILSEALRWDRIQLYLKFEQPVAPQELDVAREWVRRRAQGEPLAYILGKKFFYRSNFKVNSHVLIPRPETETLVEFAVEKLQPRRQDSINILDLGSGSGCIGLSLALEFPQAKVTLADVSSEALAVAKENALELGLADRAEWVCGPAQEVSFGNSSEKFDLIVSNPPYLELGDRRIEDSVLNFEPHLALFAEDQGFDLVRQWSERAASLLSEGGWMIFEIGLDQGGRALQHFNKLGLNHVALVTDLSGVDRFISGQK